MRVFMKATVLVSSIGLSALFFGGCNRATSPVLDNGTASAQLAANEVANMDADGIGQSGLSKTVAAGDTINGIVHPYAWNDAGQCFVRTASFTTSNRCARTRIDTITFYNAAGIPLRHPGIDSVSTIHHVRHVVQSRGDITADLDFDIIDSIYKTPTDTFKVKNGSMTGTLDGMQIASRTISGVKRELHNGMWQFPTAGEIDATFPRYSYVIVFEGNDEAQATITNLVNHRQTAITLTVDQN